MKVKDVVFCFENLEQISIPVSCVEYYSFTGVHFNYQGYDSGNFSRMRCADEAVVFLKKDVDEYAISSFGDMKHSFTERLYLYADCVGIDLVFDNGKRKEIYVPWEDGENEYTNKLQHTFIQNNELLRGYGGMCVYFGTDDKFKEMFEQE